MVAAERKRRFGHGDLIVSDFDPAVATVVVWRPEAGKARIRLLTNDVVVERKPECIFVRGKGAKIHEFYRGYMACKVRKYEIHGHSDNEREGWYVTASWHRTWNTGYQGRHIGGECCTDLYAIVIEDKLVFRPHEHLEISQVLPQTAGPIHPGLCVFQ